ncbi:hypothetical protein OsI_32497 [Oryza sativa Indica Group]|uniref:Uncharacterized protein n=1 Tax=Oryza sativa subsp. indica TaxID=39946 RepID=B8BFJ0_ORYSI|nr:hypothetical protein OsI_32497 [Oryza sativa Indica Group]
MAYSTKEEENIIMSSSFSDTSSSSLPPLLGEMPDDEVDNQFEQCNNTEDEKDGAEEEAPKERAKVEVEEEALIAMDVAVACTG